MAKAGAKRGGARGPRKRSLENPNVPLNITDPDEDTFAALGGTRTAAGVRVTQTKALGYPAVWRAVSLISGDVAKLSLLTYRNAGADGKEVAKDHPAYRLLKYKANPGLLSFHLKQVLQLHALIRGNGYAFIDRTAGGIPVGLFVMDPERITPARVGNETFYEYKGADGKSSVVPGADVLHIKGLGYDGLQGYSALDILRDSIGAAIAARDYGARNFKNNARPGGIITHPGALKPQAVTNMRESWERIHKGVDNAHRIAILQEGCTFTPLAATARDAQLLESREFDSREIANIFGVPAHKLGDPSKVAYNSLGEENQSYYNDTLSHWLNLWSAECSDKLLAESEKAAESHTIDFDYREVQRANLASLTTYATAAIQGGWQSVDEVRALFGDNPAPDGLGKWAKPEPAPAPMPAPPARSTDGLRAVVMDTARRMAKRITSQAARQGFFDYGDCERIAAEHDKVIRDAFAPVRQLCADFGVALDDEENSERFRRCVAALVNGAGRERAGMAADAIIETAAGETADRLLGAAA
jgi:HK97 family phage portal protein